VFSLRTLQPLWSLLWAFWVLAKMLQCRTIGSSAAMCTSDPASFSQVYYGATATSPYMQEESRLHGEGCAGAHGCESLSTNNCTKSCGCHSGYQSSKADMGLANGSRASCYILSIHDSGSICRLLSEACVRA